MAAVSRYRQRPLSLSPGDPGFLRTLDVLAHEVGHQWLAEARYKVGDTVFDDLLGADEAHWSYLLDSDASFLYGADWRDNGDGTFTAARVEERYSALDLYLMGLLPKEKVPPLTLLRNPAVDRHRINREGEVVAATGTSEVLVQQLVDAMGPRQPDYLHSQKEFRLGFVFLTKPGTEPSPEDLEAVERGPARLRGALLRPHGRRRLGGHEPRLAAGGASRREPRPRPRSRLARRAAGPRRELVGFGRDARARHGVRGAGPAPGRARPGLPPSAGSRGCRASSRRAWTSRHGPPPRSSPRSSPPPIARRASPASWAARTPTGASAPAATSRATRSTRPSRCAP